MSQAVKAKELIALYKSEIPTENRLSLLKSVESSTASALLSKWYLNDWKVAVGGNPVIAQLFFTLYYYKRNETISKIATAENKENDIIQSIEQKHETENLNYCHTLVHSISSTVHHHKSVIKHFSTISGLYKEIKPTKPTIITVMCHGHGFIEPQSDLHISVFVDHNRIGGTTVIQSTQVVPFTTVATTKLPINNTSKITVRMKNNAGKATVHLYSPKMIIHEFR
eukprot:130354_1